MRIIGGRLRGKTILPPQGYKARPTTDFAKEGLFNILNNEYELEGLKVLDLFGGTGSISFEFASRGASMVYCVEMLPLHAGFIKSQAAKFGLKNLTVVRHNVFEFLEICREKFDIILLDPPYAEVFLENSIKRITEIDILQSGGIIVAERPLGKELPWEFPGYTRSKDYKYGKTLLTLYRKDG